MIFGMLSMGWRGSARHWHRYQVAYLLLAGLATPLVLSVHTVVSFDFATSVIPGPIVFGIIPSTVDAADGGLYGFINRGLITTRPLNSSYWAAEWTTRSP